MVRCAQVSIERRHHCFLLGFGSEAVGGALHDNELVVEQHLVELVGIGDRNSLILGAVDRKNLCAPAPKHAFGYVRGKLYLSL